MTWRERIAEARARGKFTEEDEKQAAAWSTCAVGEQREHYPDVVKWAADGDGRYIPGHPGPLDDKLMNLGCALWGFYGAVLEDQPDKAEKLLNEIEDRVLELKRNKAV